MGLDGVQDGLESERPAGAEHLTRSMTERTLPFSQDSTGKMEENFDPGSHFALVALMGLVSVHPWLLPCP